MQTDGWTIASPKGLGDDSSKVLLFWEATHINALALKSMRSDWQCALIMIENQEPSSPSMHIFDGIQLHL